jgi:hypothetical protein
MGKQDSGEIRGRSIKKETNYLILVIEVLVFLFVLYVAVLGVLNPQAYWDTDNTSIGFAWGGFWVLISLPLAIGAIRRWKMRDDPHKSHYLIRSGSSSGGGGFYDAGGGDF